MVIGVGGENRTHFHGFAIQCPSNWLHLHNLVPLVRFELTYYTPLFERGDFTNLSTEASWWAR